MVDRTNRTEGRTIYGDSISLPKSILDAQEKVSSQSSSPVVVEREVSTEQGIRIWETPVLDRGKLRDHLNTLEQHSFEIFTILPIDKTTVQVVCFRNVVEPKEEQQVGDQ